MIRLIALAFALTLASSAQAMPLPNLDVPDGLVTQVAQACGVGMRRVSGVCVSRAGVRQDPPCCPPGCPANPPRRPPLCKMERRRLPPILLILDRPSLLAGTTGEQI